MAYFITLALALFIMISHADNCGLNLYGTAHVGLSEGATIFSSNQDYSQHTFDFWFNPQKHVSYDQYLLQTGTVESAQGPLWAIEFMLKTTIWEQGQSLPSSSVLYIDIWTNNFENEDEKWSKSRFYTVIGRENFPWLHVSFSSGGNGILLNGKYKRLEKFTKSLVEGSPKAVFAIGAGFHGAFDEVRIWNSAGDTLPDIRSSLCLDSIQANLELYLPFNECRGSVFQGHTHEGTVCALLYGSFEQASLSPVSDDVAPRINYGDEDIFATQRAKPIWIHASPVVSRECTPKEGVEMCSGAKRMSDDHQRTTRSSLSPSKHASKSSGNQYHVLVSQYMSVFGFPGSVTVIVVMLVSMALLVAGLIHYRYRNIENAQTRPRAKSIHTV